MTSRKALPLAALALVLALIAGCAASDQSQRGDNPYNPYGTQDRDRNAGTGPGGGGGGY